MVKKKVLILLPVFDLGGAEKQGLYAAKELKDHGKYEPVIWAFNKSSGNLIPLIDAEGIPHKNLNIEFSDLNSTKSRFFSYLRVIRLLRKERFYGMLPFTYHANLLTIFCFRFAGIKKALWFQIAMEYHIGFGRFEKIGLMFKPVYASNSYTAGTYIKTRHGLKADEKVHFIPNPLEVKQEIKSIIEWRKELGFSDKDFVFGMVANFYQEKDHLTLLKSVKTLKEKGANFKLILVGDNTREDNYILSLKSFILDNELYDIVKFAGVVNDIPGLLKSLDCALLTSTTEGSPNALIEYVAYGIPVIVSNIGPNIEIVGKEYPYIFKATDTGLLTEKMEEMISKSGELSSLLKTNQDRVLSTFNQEENLKAFLEILDN